MLWQYLIVGLIIAAAVAFLARQTWRTWFGAKGGCGAGCSCAGKASDVNAGPQGSGTKLVSVDELTARIRSRS